MEIDAGHLVDEPCQRNFRVFSYVGVYADVPRGTLAQWVDPDADLLIWRHVILVMAATAVQHEVLSAVV
jgi:hypothetical protein